MRIRPVGAAGAFRRTKYVGNGIYDDSHRFITAPRHATPFCVASPSLARSAMRTRILRHQPVQYKRCDLVGWTATTPGPDSSWYQIWPTKRLQFLYLMRAGPRVRTNLFATYRELSPRRSHRPGPASHHHRRCARQSVAAVWRPGRADQSFLGLSDTLYRMRIGTASLRHHWPRDVLTLSGTCRVRIP